MEFNKEGLLVREKTFPLLLTTKSRLRMEEHIRHFKLSQSAGKLTREPIQTIQTPPNINFLSESKNVKSYRPRIQAVPIRELLGPDSDEKRSNKKSTGKKAENVCPRQPVIISELLKDDKKPKVSSRRTFFNNRITQTSNTDRKPAPKTRKSLFPTVYNTTIKKKLIDESPHPLNPTKDFNFPVRSVLHEYIFPKTVAKQQPDSMKKIKQFQSKQVDSKKKLTPRLIISRKSIDSNKGKFLKPLSTIKKTGKKNIPVVKPSIRKLEDEFTKTCSEDEKYPKPYENETSSRKSRNFKTPSEKIEWKKSKAIDSDIKKIVTNTVQSQSVSKILTDSTNFVHGISLSREQLIGLESYLMESIKTLSLTLDQVRKILYTEEKSSQILSKDTRVEEIGLLAEHSYSTVSAVVCKRKNENHFGVEKDTTEEAKETIKSQVHSYMKEIQSDIIVNTDIDIDILEYPVAINETVVTSENSVFETNDKENKTTRNLQKCVDKLTMPTPPRRRSLRLLKKVLIEKINKQIDDSEDSFLTLERELNIIHNDRVQNTPHKNQVSATSNFKENCDPSLREYLSLKSDSKILNTPDIEKLRHKSILNTPRTTISTCVLSQLHNLYIDSPTKN